MSMVNTSILFILLSMAACSAQVVQAQDAVDIKILQFGTGNAFRPGDHTGIQLELTSRLDGDQPVWIQWDHDTPDGDIFAFGRSIILSPGQPIRTWLHVPLPPDTTLDSTGRIRARSIEDGVPMEELGILRFQTISTGPKVIPRHQSMIAVIGSDAAGLEAYEKESLFQKKANITGEGTSIVMLPNSGELPDHWTGLRSFNTIVWTDSSTELSPAQEDALLEWIHRGGHLVIVLPQTGNNWSLGAGNDGPLGAIMPQAPRILDDVQMYKILDAMVKYPPVPNLEQTIPVQIFRDEAGTFNAASSEEGWYPSLTIDDVGTVVVQRHHGKGQLTVIGIDLTSKAIRDAALNMTSEQILMSEHVPEADRFWNALLARRVDTPVKQSVEDLQKLNRINRKQPRQWLVDDDLILAEIADFTQFGSFLMIGFLLFIVYWIVAIPLSWSLLRYKNKTQWSWFVFLGLVALFSLLSWITVRVMREGDTSIRHLTVLDHVHGEQEQHAVSWISLFTPGYGQYELNLMGDDANVILPWESEDNSFGRFPDSRETIIDVEKSTNSLMIPSRATTTQLRIDWKGPIADSNWGDTLRMESQRPIHVVRNADGDVVGLRGTIKSLLPEALVHGQIILVDRAHEEPRMAEMLDGERQPWVRQSHSGRMERIGWSWALSEPLPPGGALALDTLPFEKDENDLEESILIQYGSQSDNIGGAFSAMSRWDRLRSLQAVSIYHQLEPPPWITIEPQAGQTGRNWTALRREIGHELDLSHWLSRPVLIVTGFLEGAELPLPLRIDGDSQVNSDGLVMVRWIMPLPEE